MNYTAAKPTKSGYYYAYHEHAAKPFDQPRIVQVTFTGGSATVDQFRATEVYSLESFTHWCPVPAAPLKDVDETARTIDKFGDIQEQEDDTAKLKEIAEYLNRNTPYFAKYDSWSGGVFGWPGEGIQVYLKKKWHWLKSPVVSVCYIYSPDFDLHADPKNREHALAVAEALKPIGPDGSNINIEYKS